MVFDRVIKTIQYLGQLGVLTYALIGAPSVSMAQETNSNAGAQQSVSAQNQSPSQSVAGTNLVDRVTNLLVTQDDSTPKENLPKNKEASFGFNYNENSASGSVNVSKFSDTGFSGTLGATQTVRASRLLEMSGHQTFSETTTSSGTGFWRGDLSDSLRYTAMFGGNLGRTEGVGSDTEGWKVGTTLSSNAFTGGFVYRVNGINNDNRDSTTTTTDWKLGFNTSFGRLRTGLTRGRIDNETDQTLRVGSRVRNASHSQETDYWTLTASYGGTSLLYSRRNLERSRARVGFSLTEGSRLYLGHSQTGGWNNAWDVRMRLYGDHNVVDKIEAVENAESTEQADIAQKKLQLQNLTKIVSYTDCFASTGTDDKSHTSNLRLGIQYGVQNITPKKIKGWNASLSLDEFKQAGESSHYWNASVERSRDNSSFGVSGSVGDGWDKPSVGVSYRFTF